MRQGWEIKKLGDVCEIYQPKTISTNEMVQDGKYLVYGANGVIGKYDKYNHEFPQLLITCRGATCGSVNISEPHSWINGNAMVVRPKDNSISLKFLEYLFRGGIDISKNITGAAQPQITRQALAPFEICYPKSEEEQQRIVSILDKTFAAIDKAKANLQQNLQNAKELFESYLQEIFSNKRQNWQKESLGNVCNLFQGLAINAKTKHALVEKSDLPLLRIKDLKNNTEEQYVDPNNYPKNALVNEDDIIYTRTGSLGLVFRGRKGILHNNSFKVIPTSRLDKDFLFMWLQNPIFKNKIMSLALRAAQPDITHGIFKIQEIFIPPLNEQKIIVHSVNALKNKILLLEDIYIQKLSSLEELKKSILQKAFAGELTAAPKLYATEEAALSIAAEPEAVYKTKTK